MAPLRAGKRGTMIWRKVNIFCCVVLLSVSIFSNCGVPDKALVLTRDGQVESNAETGDDTSGKNSEKSVGSGDESGASGEETDTVPGTETDAKQQMIVVYVCGAVQNPGVVELPQGSRAADALEAVDGLLESAQPDYVNLAAKLEDAQKLYFPTKEEAVQLIKQEADEAGGMVNINTAGIEQLCTLPGIGEARAGDIVAYREKHGDFQTKEDLMKVSGIKQSAYDKLQDRITIN